MNTQIYNFHDIVLYVTIIQCLLLSLFMWVLPTQKRLSSILFIEFLLLNGMQLACILVLWNDSVQISPNIDTFIVPYVLMFALFAKGPMLLLYVESLTQRNFSLQNIHALHFLPILLCWLYLYFFAVDSNLLRWRFTDENVNAEHLVNLLWHASKWVPFFYGCAALTRVWRYHKQLKDHYSSFTTREPRWLFVLTLGFLLSWGFSILVHVSAQFLSPSLSNSLGLSENYVLFVLIIGLFMYSLAYAQQLLTTVPFHEKKPLEAKLKPRTIERVKAGMESEKLFLVHNLNIEEFAHRIDLHVREVSSVINKHFETNFFEFMNTYRIEEAKRLFTDHTLNELTVLDILQKSGFNSKSAFHRFFKRLVGVSPSQFRKMAQAK